MALVVPRVLVTAVPALFMVGCLGVLVLLGRCRLTGLLALSGWKSPQPAHFYPHNVEEVLERTDEIGYPRRENFMDHGTKGKYFASHAERQQALWASRPAIGVSKELCEDCPGWFRRLAQHEGRTWYVTDPSGTWVFEADGTVTMPTRQVVRPGEPFPGKYFSD